MKNQVDINMLFQKAASAPVHTSFDETKQLFLTALPASSIGSASKTGLLTKKWIIMFSIIITSAALGVSLLLSGESDSFSELTEVTAPRIHKTTIKAPTSPIKKTPETKPSQKTTHIELPKKLPTLDLKIEFKHALMPLMNSFVKPVFERKTKPQPYHYPNLTEKEIKDNEKRKKSMVKALAKQDKNSYVYIPSGTVEMDSQRVSIQSFIAQKHEVTNIQYKTFLFDLLINDRKADFLKAKPDQKKWTEVFGEGMIAMENTYFSEDAFNEYPVVNISREGAEMYCLWLSQQLHAYTESRGDAYFNDVRLPYRSEWRYAANGGNDSLAFACGDSIKNEKGCYLVNLDPGTGFLADDGGFHTVKVSSYLPNDFGLYCTSGNAAEMVYDQSGSERTAGTAGGSWFDTEAFLRIDGEDPNSGKTDGHPTIGFRVVMTYLSK